LVRLLNIKAVKRK